MPKLSADARAEYDDFVRGMSDEAAAYVYLQLEQRRESSMSPWLHARFERMALKNQTLEAEVAALREIAKQVAAPTNYPGVSCLLCGATAFLGSGEARHTADCPVTCARARLSKETPHAEP